MKSQLTKKINAEWHSIAVPGRLEKCLPDGWSVKLSPSYDGGSIELRAHGKEVLTIVKDIEYHRLEIDIVEECRSREARLMAFIDQLCDRCIEIGTEERNITRKSEAQHALSLIDKLPDHVEIRETAWMIGLPEQVNQDRFTSGPYAGLDEAIRSLGAGEVAVEKTGDLVSRAVTLGEDGQVIWHDRDGLRTLTSARDEPQPG